MAECAGVGDCDRTAGKCQCRAPFTGDACERIDCPRNCNNNGRCISLKQAGEIYDGFQLKVPATVYNQWDAERIFGCYCDRDFSGSDCSIQTCPEGDDPLTAGVPEVQQITCVCPGGCTSGNFQVRLGERVVGIPYNAVATIAEESPYSALGSGSAVGESVESRLKQLRDWPTFNSISFGGGLLTACSGGSGTTITVNFLKSAGNMPEMISTSGSLVAAGGIASVYGGTTTQGTTERIPCSGRGSCLLGSCVCEAGYFSSDGNGGPGYINDCGSVTNPANLVSTNVLACIKTGCSGHGLCSGANPTNLYTCTCFKGWTGPGCDRMECPTGPAWFDEPALDGTAHANAVCSNAGTCDTTKGKCQCFPGFAGIACQRLACPSSSVTMQCSGHGRCLTLREMASKGYFGGDRLGVNEKQTFTCSLTAGSFTLSHKGYATIPISYLATAAALQAALEALPTIEFLRVRIQSFTGASTPICSSSGTQSTIEFLSDGGDQPLLVYAPVTASNPAPAAGVGQGVVVETTKGTRPMYGDDVPGGAQWDSESVTSCVCDGLGDASGNKTDAANGDMGYWIGTDCGQRTCPTGINPSGKDAVMQYEVQRLSCSATGGTFTLGFRGYTTAAIAYDATSTDVKTALELLPSVGMVTVAEVSGWVPGAGMCGTGGVPGVLDITFTTELGDVQLLVADGYLLTAGGTITATETAKGYGQAVECSNKGRCSRTDGLCECEQYWYSSNGLGKPGRRGDCGTFQVQGVLSARKVEL